MTELRETIERAVCEAVCENDGIGYPLMRWATDRTTWEAAADAVLAAIAQDAVVIERDRWKRVSNAVRSFKQAEQEDANMDDAVYCHVCMDAVQPNDLDELP